MKQPTLALIEAIIENLKLQNQKGKHDAVLTGLKQIETNIKKYWND